MTTEPTVVGMFFHTFLMQHDGCHLVENQGRIVAKLKGGWYLIEMFDWLLNEPSCHQVANLRHMAEWWLYPDIETMHQIFEVQSLGQRVDAHRKHPKERHDRFFFSE